MPWYAGPGELTQIVFNDGSTDVATITSDFIEGYSLATEKDSYDAAVGHSVDRGSMTKTISANAFDVSAISALSTLMTNRTESTVTVKYQDTVEQDIDGAIIRITPLLHNVSDVANAYFDAAGNTANTNLATSWTDLGVTLDVPTLSFSFPFDGTDGEGRPYFSTCGVESEFMIPADKYSSLVASSSNGVCKVAFKLPDGNFMVLKGGRLYKNYADEDASMPRAVRVVYRSVATTWGDLVEFTNGSDGVSPALVTEEFDASGTPSLRKDYLHGVLIEAVGRGYQESDVVSWPVTLP